MKKVVILIVSILISLGCVYLCVENLPPSFRNPPEEKRVELSNGAVIVVLENYSNANGNVYKDATLTITGIELSSDGILDIPSFVDNMPITRINANALKNSWDLKKISLPSTLTDISSFFYLCTGLEIIDIGECIAEINYEKFMHCKNLNVVNVSPQNKRYYFENGCLVDRETNTLVLGLSEFAIPNTIKNIGDYAFSGKIHTDQLLLPEGIQSIGNYAFENCTIDTLYIPNSVETIGIGAFSYSSISSVDLPESLKCISSQLFWNCEALEKVKIGKNVDSIGENAFAWCSNLSTIIVHPDNQTYYSDQNCLIEKETNRLILCGNGATISEKIQVLGKGSLSEACTLGEQFCIRIPQNVCELETLSICGYEGYLTAVYIPISVVTMGECAITLTGSEKNLMIYCEALNKPSGWDDNWLGNADGTKVVWGAK